MNTVAVLERVGWILQEGSADYLDDADVMQTAQSIATAIRAHCTPAGAVSIGNKLLSDWGTG